MFRACLISFFCAASTACAPIPPAPVAVNSVRGESPSPPAGPYVAYCAEAPRPPEMCCTFRRSNAPRGPGNTLPPTYTIAALWASGVMIANAPEREDDRELRAYRVSPKAVAELIALVRERVWTRAWESQHYPCEEHVAIRLSTASTLESGSVTAHYVDCSTSINAESAGRDELLPALERLRASATPLDTPVLFHTLPWARYAPYGQ